MFIMPLYICVLVHEDRIVVVVVVALICLKQKNIVFHVWKP